MARIFGVEYGEWRHVQWHIRVLLCIIYSLRGGRLFLCRSKYTSRNYSSGLIEVMPAAYQKSARDRDVRNEQANGLWNRDVMPFFKQLKIEKIIYGFSIELSLFHDQFVTWHMNFWFSFQTLIFIFAISFWIISFKKLYFWPKLDLFF